MSNLRTRIIRLAAANPELRADLLPLLKEQSDPASADQNKPESYYGLAPRGVQASHGVPSLSDPEAARRSVLAGLKKTAMETLERTRTYGGNELEKAVKIVKTMLQKHLPKYELFFLYVEAKGFSDATPWIVILFGTENPVTPELYFNIRMTVPTLFSSPLLSEVMVTIERGTRGPSGPTIRKFPFSTRILAFEFQKIAKKIQEREAKESVSGRPNQSVAYILTHGLNRKLNNKPKTATQTPQA